MSQARTLIQTLVLKYASLKTLSEGGSEVRHYRNDLTGAEQVGKRICMLGLEEAVALREAKLLQSIKHDNIVPVFDVAHVPHDPQQGYDPQMKMIELIMPHFKRGSVHDALVRGERFSVGEACLLVQAALCGLGELHERYRILHRDVKSPNFFLADDGTLKVGDLGVSAPMDDDGTAEPYPSIQMHTPPETYVLSRVDRRYDLYAVGVLLLELLHGGLRYDEYFPADMQARVQRGRPAILAAHLRPAPHVPPRLRTIIRKSVSPKPEKRFSTAREMRDALSRVPLVDWRAVVVSAERLLWEGESAQRRDRRFQVEAVKRRNGQWTMAARQHVTRWQKFLPDRLMSTPTGADAEHFFDQVFNVAFSR
jgi:serine/threonine protein kinase